MHHLRLSTTFTAVLVTIVLNLAGALHAQSQIITVTHTYVLGDNDSRNDARQICLLEAKRKVLEKASVYIQTQSEVTNLQLSRDKISSYSAAVLSVEISNEVFEFQNGHNTMTLTVKADVDIADVRKRLAAIATDRSLQDRITAQQKQLQQLESQVQRLTSRLHLAPVNTSGQLRKERTVVFQNIIELERKKLVAVQRVTDEMEQIHHKTQILKKYIVPGMTTEEVEGIAGKPYKSTLDIDASPIWFYGKLWVCFHTPLGEHDYRVWGVGPDAFCKTNLLHR